MLGLTPLGTIHTAIGVVAVIAGFIALARYKEISMATTPGRTYVITTIVVCLTGFGIFQHGGFGVPHVLGIVTLLVLGAAAAAEYTRFFGRASRYVATVGYSATFFFHFIPALTETGTRLPQGAPLFSSPQDPNLELIVGILFVVFLVGATAQVIRLRRSRGAMAPGGSVARV